MAVDLQGVAERLFDGFMAPLVVGGELKPGKPIGAKTALALGGRQPSDIDTVGKVGLARVRLARKIVAVALFDPAPSPEEWALGAALHDIVQAAHPGFDGAFRRKSPRRLLHVVDKLLEQIPPPASARAALSRHTWFSRLFEITRTDVTLRWWTGSATFLGEDPPTRLTAWPELRRVNQTRTPHPLMDLPSSGSAADPSQFTGAIEAMLVRSPLTDIATCTRSSPTFVWTQSSLSFIATRAGRTLALRALAQHPDHRVHVAIGRATRALFQARAIRAAGIAVDLLRERVLGLAAIRMSKSDGDPEPLPLSADDAAFAVGAGALAAQHWIATQGDAFSEHERRTMLAILAPAAKSAAANEVRALFGG